MVYFHFQDRVNTMMHFSGIKLKGGNNIWKKVKRQSNFPVWLKKTDVTQVARARLAFIKQTPSTIFLFVCTFKKAEKYTKGCFTATAKASIPSISKTAIANDRHTWRDEHASPFRLAGKVIANFYFKRVAGIFSYIRGFSHVTKSGEKFKFSDLA